MSDLALDLDPSLGRQAGVEDALRRAVMTGRLPAGTRLPSSRALASDLGCARATVVGAYEQLVAEGYLLARHGAGTTVADVHVPEAASSPRPARRRVPLSAEFLPGEPDRSSFPRAQWMASTRRVLATTPDELFGYGEPRGLDRLRNALAAYLARSRAVVADPDRIVVFGGFADALGVLARTLATMGASAVAVEDPGLPPHRRVLGDAGLRVLPVMVDDAGVSVISLAREAADAAAVLTTPAHQYPLGVAMAAARRTALVDWARRDDRWIIEDDYDGEFRYDRQPIGALQGLDPDRVIYGGTASKSLVAGLRLAWLVLPPALVGPVTDELGWPGAVSNLEQAVLADFVASGRLDRHVRRMRTEYRRRRDALVAMLVERAPDLTLAGISAGLHVTAYLPDGPDDAEEGLIAQAAARSIGLYGLGQHWCGEPRAAGLVLGYSRSPAHAYGATVARLGELMAAR